MKTSSFSRYFKSPALHLSTFETATGKMMICNDVKHPPRPSLYSNPFRLPLTSLKMRWEREWEAMRDEEEPEMIARWEKEMVGDALVSFHEAQKLKETLVFDFSNYPYDMKALMIRLQIAKLEERYPLDLEYFFLGDWDYFNQLKDTIAEIQERIDNDPSQKHLENVLILKEDYEKDLFIQGILIGCKHAPRVHLSHDDLPADHEDNLDKYQKPSEPTKKTKEQIKKRLFCREAEKKEGKNWLDAAEMHVEIPIVPRKEEALAEEERRDPHEVYFEMIYKDISEEFLEEDSTSSFFVSSPLNSPASPSSPSPKKRKLENPIGYFSPFSPSF